MELPGDYKDDKRGVMDNRFDDGNSSYDSDVSLEYSIEADVYDKEEYNQVELEFTEQKTNTKSEVPSTDSTAAGSTKHKGGKVGRVRKRGYIYDPKPIKEKSPKKDGVETMSHRERNNEAARRSRKCRREKELEVLGTKQKLQETNATLIAKVKELEEKNSYLENLLLKIHP